MLALILTVACSVDRSLRAHRFSRSRTQANISDRVVDGEYITGTSSYYGKKFHGRKTASGEIFNMYDFTAAHKTLPFGTMLEVENLENNKKVVVRINDRGPFVGDRILDLSYAAAREIDMIKTGTTKIRAKILIK
jgi:rare lipoprotein A